MSIAERVAKGRTNTGSDASDTSQQSATSIHKPSLKDKLDKKVLSVEGASL